MGRPRPRVLNVPWDRDLVPTDLEPVGLPDFTRDIQRNGKAERQIGLHVFGTFGVYLGVLAMRCGRAGSEVTPLTLSIADTPVRIDVEPAQSNPRRSSDSEDGS
jgi:hypothetical protein